MDTGRNLEDHRWIARESAGKRGCCQWFALTLEGGGQQQALCIFLTDGDSNGPARWLNAKVVSAVQRHEGRDLEDFLAALLNDGILRRLDGDDVGVVLTERVADVIDNR